MRSVPTLSVSRSARCCAEGPGHSDFLDLCVTNGLVEGTLNVLGTPVDLSKVMCDSFVAGYTDHLIPLDRAYRTT